MDDLRVYVLYNSYSVISGPWADDAERLSAVEFRYPVQKFLPRAGLKPGTARLVGQHLTH